MLCHYKKMPNTVCTGTNPVQNSSLAHNSSTAMSGLPSLVIGTAAGVFAGMFVAQNYDVSGRHS